MAALGVPTASGSFIDFDDVMDRGIEQEFCLRDIAVALAAEARFNGCTTEPYFVAQHSVVVYHIVRVLLGATAPTNRGAMCMRGALLHDGHEAFTKDLPQPLKYYIRRYTDAYDELSYALQQQIHRRFVIQLNEEDDMLIHRADAIALQFEAKLWTVAPTYQRLCAKYGWGDDKDLDSLMQDVRIYLTPAWGSAQSRDSFLAVAEELEIWD